MSARDWPRTPPVPGPGDLQIWQNGPVIWREKYGYININIHKKIKKS